MDDLIQELSYARQELTPQWDVERAARLYAATRQRGRRRVVRRAASASVVAVAAMAALAIGLQGSARREDAVAAGSPRTDGADRGHILRLVDGSRAELAGAHTDLEVVQNSKSRVSLRLVSGRAHFEVVRDPLRSFVVESGAYRVEVIGTSFDVERNSHEVMVSVARGKVRVYGPSGAEDLAAGERKHFAATPGSTAVEAAVEPEPANQDEAAPILAAEEARVRPRSKRAAGSNQSGWRSLTQSGQYEAAYALIQQTSNVDDDPAALMDAADAARLSGHPKNAVQYLERVVRDHRKSPIAPLAAFTAGRVYLDKLGQPDQAAISFELARRLAPSGSLAQDALAREVEALSKGGNAQRAFVRAQEYLREYPNGRRVRAVQLYGGLE